MSYSFTGSYSLEAGRMRFALSVTKAMPTCGVPPPLARQVRRSDSQDRAGRVAQKNGQCPGLFRLRELDHSFHHVWTPCLRTDPLNDFTPGHKPRDNVHYTPMKHANKRSGGTRCADVVVRRHAKAVSSKTRDVPPRVDRLRVLPFAPLSWRRPMRSFLIGCGGVLSVVLGGCLSAHDCYEVEIRPKGWFHRKLTCWHVGGQGNKVVSRLDHSQLARIRKLYPKRETPIGVPKQSFSGRFRGALRPTSAAPVLHAFDVRVGSASAMSSGSAGTTTWHRNWPNAARARTGSSTS